MPSRGERNGHWFSPPPHVDHYPDLFQVPVQFDSNRNALQIDPVWDTPETQFEPGNAYAFGIFTRHADATIRAQIEAEILLKMHEGSISMDKVAHDIAMSRQTLYPRLKDEGITLAEIHDDLRRHWSQKP